MLIITLTPLYHKGSQQIGISFSNNTTLNTVLKKINGVRWSKSNKCWYLALSKQNYTALTTTFKEVATINNQALKQYLLQKKEAPQPVSARPTANTPVTKVAVNLKPSTTPPATMHRLSTANSDALKKFTQHLILKAYSPSTIRTYTNELVQFLNTLNSQPASSFTVPRLKDYFQYCFVTLKLSEATLHSRINALKFYYEQVLGQEKFFWEIPRPKKPEQLPKVLDEKEIGRMFNAITNLKHKAILFTAYSAGLRVSEVVNLKIKHIDSERMQVFIAKAKGKKDRYVGLSLLLLDVLRAYLKSLQPMPRLYLFENPYVPGEAYSVRSAQKIFQQAKEKAFINKDVGIHSLRHSFATHLLEKGIDIKYIKDLLGHFDIRTTERYLHVKKETLVNIPNVLDELNKTFTLEW